MKALIVLVLLLCTFGCVTIEIRPQMPENCTITLADEETTVADDDKM